MKLRADPMRMAVVARYATPDALKRAVRTLREAGYDRLDAYVPYELPGLSEALGLPRPKLPWLVFFLGMAGAILAYLFQWWITAVDYPLNVGGRPLHPAPAFIMITFETGVLWAACTAFLGVLLGSRLPEPWTPLFELPGFDSASIDAFWLGVDERDSHFDARGTVEALRRTDAERVIVVGRNEGQG